LQLEIDCIEWALKKIEVYKIPNDRMEGVIRTMIKDLEKRKDKAMKRSDTDDIWIKIESLQWVLFVIFAIKNGKMVVI
jgi:DNA replication initiation complex subunit (GINS family)